MNVATHCEHQAPGCAPVPPQLSEKDLSMLEERIKRSAKETPKPVEDPKPPRALPAHANASMLRRPADDHAPAKSR